MKPDFDKLLDFWKIIRPLKKNEYVEIRLTDNTKPPEYYQHMKYFLEQHPDIISKNLSQLFIQKFSQLTLILSYGDNYFFKNYKICYGISLREKVKGDLGGSYDFVKTMRFVFFDIDKADHTDLLPFEQKLLDVFLFEQVIPWLKRFGLETPSAVVHSGGGRHCLYRVASVKITESRRRWFRDFVKNVSSRLSTSIFEIDGIFDLTRVFGLPETMNVKRDVKVQSMILNEVENSNFKVRSSRKKKHKKTIKFSKSSLPSLNQSLEWHILCHEDVPQGEVHQTILFATKLLMKELEIVDYEDYEAEMNDVRGSHHKMDPWYGTEDKNYSPYIIINWCRRNDAWCKKHNIVYEGYAERIMKKLEEMENVNSKEQGSNEEGS